jgi:hypothetical protein
LVKPLLVFEHENKFINERMWRHNQIETKALASSSLYFVYSISGFISQSQMNMFQDFTNELRSFYGACLAHDILHPFRDPRFDAIIPIIMCAPRETGEIVQVASCDTDITYSTYFYDALSRTRINKVSSFEKLMEPVREFLNCKSDKLRTAAIWYLRALTSNRPLDQVLESAITLEVLLGDQQMSDRVGLTKLMANRCAYALGAVSLREKTSSPVSLGFTDCGLKLCIVGRLVTGARMKHL